MHRPSCNMVTYVSRRTYSYDRFKVFLYLIFYPPITRSRPRPTLVQPYSSTTPEIFYYRCCLRKRYKTYSKQQNNFPIRLKMTLTSSRS